MAESVLKERGGYGLKKIMVVGIGNLIMQDDGAGVHVVNCLSEMDIPAEVELIDGGTYSYDLVDFFCQGDTIIVIDAMQAGGEPGTIYRAPLEQLGLQFDSALISVHDLGFVQAAQHVNMLGHYPQILVYGIEPKTLGLGLELSPEIAAQVPKVAELIKKDIDRLLEML
jgi:hydrogenase maturation protease